MSTEDNEKWADEEQLMVLDRDEARHMINNETGHPCLPNGLKHDNLRWCK